MQITTWEVSGEKLLQTKGNLWKVAFVSRENGEEFKDFFFLSCAHFIIFFGGGFMPFLGVCRATDQLLVFSDLLPESVGPACGSSSKAGTCTLHNLRWHWPLQTYGDNIFSRMNCSWMFSSMYCVTWSNVFFIILSICPTFPLCSFCCMVLIVANSKGQKTF